MKYGYTLLLAVALMACCFTPALADDTKAAPQAPPNLDIMAQNIQTIAKQLYQHEQSLQAVGFNIARINFYLGYLKDKGGMSDVMTKAEAAWKESVSQAQADAKKIQDQQAEIDKYKAQLEEMQKSIDDLKKKIGGASDEQ